MILFQKSSQREPSPQPSDVLLRPLVYPYDFPEVGNGAVENNNPETENPRFPASAPGRGNVTEHLKSDFRVPKKTLNSRKKPKREPPSLGDGCGKAGPKNPFLLIQFARIKLEVGGKRRQKNARNHQKESLSGCLLG